MQARSASLPPMRPDRASWGFEPGALIAPGRSVVKHLGGGNAYEVFLVWDDHRFALMVAKVLRPDRAEDPAELRSLRSGRPRRSTRSPTRSSCAASTPCSTAPTRTC